MKKWLIVIITLLILTFSFYAVYQVMYNRVGIMAAQSIG